jgi:outer membrane receptor protein involved in Fe transport
MQFKKTLLAAAVLVALPTVSYAQLEEVIVTATKRTASLQDVPMAITAFNADQIVRLGATNFTDLATQVPSLSLRSAGPGRTKLNIRGISAATGFAPTVSFYLDEMPIQTISSGSSTSFQQTIIDPKLYDLERIEVLRGPQGTLYGASSMGGTVRLITAKPLVGENEGSVNFDVSNTEDGRQWHV